MTNKRCIYYSPCYVLPEQLLNPSPVYPIAHVQPKVFEQVALMLHPSLILVYCVTSENKFIVKHIDRRHLCTKLNLKTYNKEEVIVSRERVGDFKEWLG